MRITTVPLSLHKLLKGQMAFMVQQGFEVMMVSSDGPEINAVIKDEGCPHQVVHMTRELTPFQDLRSLWNLYFLIRQYRPHIVHTHTPKAGLLGMLAARMANVPLRMHTIAGLPWIETKGVKRFVLKCAERLTAWSAQYVYVNSRSLMDYLFREKIITDLRKMKVIGAGTSNGIDLDFFSDNIEISKKANQLKKETGLNENGRVWLFVGRVVIDKGIKELYNAFCSLHHEFPDDQLWLVGPLELKNALPESLLDALKKHTNIYLWDYQDDVRPFMKAAYTLVFPSYREGFPNVPLQAAAMGCPLILSDINGCNELVTDEQNGLLVTVKDDNKLNLAMLRMRKDNDMRLAFIEKTLQIVKNQYSQSQIHQSLKSEYLNALNLIKG
jgi:glycosyltransferase involved in cell wall biosynthesis